MPDNGCEGQPLKELKDALASELRPEFIGGRLMALVAASELLRHSDARSTVRDYIHPQDDDLEGQFVQDVLCSTTVDVARKWFGGSALRYAELAHAIAGNDVGGEPLA